MAGVGHGGAVAFVMISVNEAFGPARLHRFLGVNSFLTGALLLFMPEVAGINNEYILLYI
jgi:hypothetical protein